MFQKYLVTGAGGFLGRAVLAELKKKKAEIRALVLENDPLTAERPDGVDVVVGDVCDDASLERFFSGADRRTCVIHCAGIVSVASHPGERLYQVNVGGTNHILRHCEKRGVGKLVYVSSVHAIPERPKGTEITEEAVFSPDLVKGDYAKSKALATALVFEAASRGLNASVVFPSGIIGPGDSGKGSITHMLLSFLAGKLPLAVKGGYDFVDVRDVAAGIAACAERGAPGRGYILSGQYASIRDILKAAQNTLRLKRAVTFLPLCLAKLVAPFYEKRSLRKKQPLYFTPYAVAVLDSNSRFSRKSAAAALGYAPRSLQSSIRDTVLWLKKTIVREG
ncbi:MAG: NAD-dependent epimerase/dehydratase family protein [Eubacteriales bacterium]|nr:NAD-dependent epimerase/dehydratase family protein [Eubacteriales bacterium]